MTSHTESSVTKGLALATALALVGARDARAQGTCSPSAAPASMELVSLSDLGTQTQGCTTGGCKNNSHPSLSAAGDVIAYSSDAGQVVTGFLNPAHVPQVYVRDLPTGQVVLLSRGLAPGQLADGLSDFPHVSGDGRVVVFGSFAGNLVPNDTNGLSDVFSAVAFPYSLERLSQNPNGVPFDGESTAPHPSADGRLVVFVTEATNPSPLFVPGGSMPAPALLGTAQVVLCDRNRPGFEFISMGPRMTRPNGPAGEPRLDLSGRRVSFSSQATNMGVADPNGPQPDIFVLERSSRRLALVSAAWGAPRSTCASGSRRPAISANGRWVVFESAAANLVAPGLDTNGLHDIFVRDLQTGAIALVSVSSSGGLSNGGSGYGAISGDGRYVMFTSTADNLVPNDLTSFLECFVRDRDADADGIMDEPGASCTWRLSASPLGVPANARSGGNGALSYDGRFGVFMSEADTLVPGDGNGSAPGSACGPTCLFGRDVFRAGLY